MLNKSKLLTITAIALMGSSFNLSASEKVNANQEMIARSASQSSNDYNNGKKNKMDRDDDSMDKNDACCKRRTRSGRDCCGCNWCRCRRDRCCD